jgi:hypothetical protein
MKRALVRFTSAYLLALTAGCGGDGPVDPEDDGDGDPLEITSFGFMVGDWEVTSRYTGDDGVEQTAASARVRRTLDGTAWKAQLIGERGGEPFEARTLLTVGDNDGMWLIARGDGVAGTFDVLEGSFADDGGTFVSREGTRPDGSMERLVIDDVTTEGFRLTVARSNDGGAAWTTYWELEYTEAGSDFQLPSAPATSSGCAAAEYAQFDFWFGDWNAGQGRNDIKKQLGGCILEENWMAQSNGTSFNMYDWRTERWTQVWRGTGGLTLVIQGGLVGEQMIMSGPYRDRFQRIIWTPNADGSVVQRSETSPDGSDWSLQYELLYELR